MMKRLILALAAVATVAGPMAVATSASAQPRNDNWDRNDRDRNDRDNRTRAQPRRCNLDIARGSTTCMLRLRLQLDD